MSEEINVNHWQSRNAEDLPATSWGHEKLRYETGEETLSKDGLAPRDQDLERRLFSTEERPSKGINFSKYVAIRASIEHTDETSFEPIKTFLEAGLHPAMLDNVRLCGYHDPTPVQAYAIPCIMAGNDLLAGAQTGSGKTCAFLVPIISQLMGKAFKIRQPRTSGLKLVQPLVVIMAPSRELATQIFDECRRFCYRSLLRPCVVYGGVNLSSQANELQKGCDILVATPGRLLDFARRGVLSFCRVRFVVLDEADKMLDMSHQDVKDILASSDLPSDDSLRICMFSATFPRELRELAREFLSDDFVDIKIGRLGATTTDITQIVEYVENDNKASRLMELLLDQPPTRTVIFVNTKRQCDNVDDFLFNNKFPVTSIHGNRTQREREDALASFRSGANPILVATDVAARGIDIKGVMHVVNYEAPPSIEEYVHRIGRTARIGNMGLATTFYNDMNEMVATDLVKLLLECGQVVPDFLEQYRPEDGALLWEDTDGVDPQSAQECRL